MNAHTHANFYHFSLLECQCHEATEESCHKVTGKCGNCETGFFGEFCNKGNYKLWLKISFWNKILG